MRALLALLLAPLVSSCQPPDIAAEAAFVHGRLAFVAAASGTADAEGCWSRGTVIDDAARPVWEFSGDGTGACRRLFPLFFGRAPAGTETTRAAAPLEPGRLYVLTADATGDVRAAFSLSRAGEMTMVHNVDPDSPPAEALSRLWWDRRASRPASPAG